MKKQGKKEKTLPKLKNDLQEIFNRFIRYRDLGKPCISCGQFGLLQAGHYFPVKGYDGLRYDEDNVHGECPRCNGFDDMHLIGYNKNLFNRIGPERVQKLEEKARDYKMNGYKFTRSELTELIKIYKQKVAELERSL